MGVLVKQSAYHQYQDGATTAEEDYSQRTISVSPEEIVFTQIMPQVTYYETVTLTNNLGAPVDLILKCSNPDRLEVKPKTLRLGQSQNIKVEIKLCQTKPFHTKALKLKDFLFIKGDYFDQKVQILIYPNSKSLTVSNSSLQRDTTKSVAPLVAEVSPQKQNFSIPLAGDSFGRGGATNSRQTSIQNELKVTNQQLLRNSFDEDDEEDEKQMLSERLQQLTKENIQLREQLDQSQNEINYLKSQQTNSQEQIQAIREMLKEREPNLQRLLDEAMRIEKQKQERKEQKVLEILQFKDRQIDELQKRIVESDTNISNLRSQHQEFLNKNANLQEKLDFSLQQARSLELQLAESKDMLQDFNQTDLMKTQAQLISQAAYIKDLENQIKVKQNDTYLEEALNTCQNELNLKNTQLKQIYKEQEQQKNQLIKLENQLTFIQGELEESQRKEQKLKQKIESRKEDNNLKQQYDKLNYEQQQLQTKVKTALQCFSQITGQKKIDVDKIDISASEIVKIVEKIQQEYNQLEKDMQILIDQSLESGNKENKPNQIQHLLSENNLMKNQLGDQENELLQLRDLVRASGHEEISHQQNKSTQGGENNSSNNQIKSSQHQKSNMISVLDTLQVGVASSSVRMLNTKLKEMKLREEHLVDQISQMKQQMKYQNSFSEGVICTEQDSSQQIDQQADYNLIIRIAELEHVIFSQREQIVQLEQNLIECKRQLEDSDKDKQDKIDLLDLRNRNLQQLNKKIETVQLQYSQSDLFGSLLSKSPVNTNSDTERMKNLAQQQTEFNNMELRHKCQELNVQNLQLQQREKSLSNECDALLTELAKLKQDWKLKEVGLRPESSRIASLVQEQKQRILNLEQKLKNSNQYSGVDLTLIRVREEFLKKVEQLNQAFENERLKSSTALITANQKIENLKSQIQHMEKKELKAYNDYDLLKTETDTKLSSFSKRYQEFEKVIEAKNLQITNLERDLQQKELTLQERQEQLSVLLSAMDNGNSNSNDQKQKLANLAAELCNMMSEKSNLEKRLANLTSSEGQNYSKMQQYQQKVDELTNSESKFQFQLKDSQQLVTQFERRSGDLEQQLGELKNKLNDAIYLHERDLFLIKSKDDMINNLRDQLLKSEKAYQENLESIKQSILRPLYSENIQIHKQRENNLRVAIQKLHLILMERSDFKTSEMIKEMETTLGIAANTIEKLQQDLEVKTNQCLILDQQWDAFALNTILIQKFELFTTLQGSQRQQVHYREIEIASFVKNLIEQQLNKLMKELESQLQSLQSQNIQLSEDNSRVNEMMQLAQNQNEQLKQQVFQLEEQIKYTKDEMQLKAEISVDERYNAKNEAIQTYFDNRLIKLLQSTSQSSERDLELGREICALKLQIINIKKLHSADLQKKDSLEHTVRQAKQNILDLQNMNADLKQKMQNQQSKLTNQITQANSEQERIKKVNLKLEKELIKLNDLLNQKVSDINVLKLQQDQNEKQILAPFTQQDLKVDLSRKVQELQEEVIELRQNRMLEIDELRLQYELEVAHAKRDIQQQQNEIEQQFGAGSTPGEILDQNHELKEQLNHSKQNEIQMKNENYQLKQQCQELETHAENMSREVEDIKQSLQDVESLLLLQQGQNNKKSSIVTDELLYSQGVPHSIQQSLSESKRSKSALKNKNKTVNLLNVTQISAPQMMSENQFIKNPPMLVRALVQAKINEQQSKAKLRRQLQTEIYLRQQLSSKLSPQTELVSDLINQNDTILQILNEQAQISGQQWNLLLQSEVEENQSVDDYNCLVNTVLSLANELAKYETSKIDLIGIHETLPLPKVLQAQRIVIKSLTEKFIDKQIRYVPERENDKKIWLLELLEQQVNDAESQIDRLVDFIKRLQVAVTGNLQSAAEIRATSIDLANNTKEASEEIKSLRHVAALIKHEICSMIQQNNPTNPFQDQNQETLNKRAGNSFQNSKINLQAQSHQSLDRILTERDSAQNQLSLTSKIKQSLEHELINNKLHHATELQSHIQHIKNLQSQVSSNNQIIEDLNQQISQQNTQIQSERDQNNLQNKKIGELESQLERIQQKCEKQAGSSTSLRKLQLDMQDWRKISDTNLKNKQEALDIAQSELTKIKQEFQRIKSENLMLRRVQQENRNGEEQNQFLKEIDTLRQQLSQSHQQNQQLQQNFSDEKAILNQKIEKLESIIGQGDSLASQEVSKLIKKLSQIQNEVKSKQSELTSIKDQFTQAGLEKIELEQKLSDNIQKMNKLKNRFKDLQQVNNQLQAEKEEIFKQKVMVLETQDNGAQQIAEEMIGLRETFLKLKTEKENLTEQINLNQQNFDRRERDWRAKIQELEIQLKRQDSVQTSKLYNETESISILNERNKALLNDLKYFKEQTERLNQRCQELIEKQANHESIQLANQQEQSQLEVKLEDTRKEMKQTKDELAEKDHLIRQNALEISEAESNHNQQLKVLNQNFLKVRFETQSMMQALAQQMQLLKQQKYDKDKKPIKEVDLSLQIVQKDSALQLLKKEFALEKQKVAKLKSQKTELKQKVQTLEQQSQSQKPNSKKQVVQIATPQLSKWKEDILEMLSNSNQLKKTLKAIRDSNAQEIQLIEARTQLQQIESNLFANQQQNEELQLKVEELQELILEQKANSKNGKQSLIEKYNTQIASLKDHIKNLQQDLAQIKNESVPVDETQNLMEQNKDYQQAIKQLQAELQRKNKLIASLRQQKDSTTTELELVMQDLKGLKDDNKRLQKALKEGRSSNNDIKEMRETYEWLQQQEKQMKEELVILHEKNKILKQDLSRKDSQIKDYKDQCHQKSKEADTVKDINSTVERLKEEKKKLKLELEISQNQVRALKQQIEQTKIQSPIQQTSQINTQTQNIEIDLKQARLKTKRYEQILKKSIRVLQKIGTGVVKLVPDDSVSSKKIENVSISDQSSNQDYLRDAGEILGVSMNELEDFINAGVGNTPGKISMNSNDSQQQRIVKKLRKIEQQPLDSNLDGDIDEIGEYCVKLLEEINQVQRN